MGKGNNLDWIRIGEHSHACNLPNGILIRSTGPDRESVALCFVPDLMVNREDGDGYGSIERKSKDYQDA